MTTLREAAEAALKALRYAMEHMQCDERGKGPDCAPVLQARIDLSAALAVQPQAEREGLVVLPKLRDCLFQALCAWHESSGTPADPADVDQLSAYLTAWVVDDASVPVSAPPAPAHEADLSAQLEQARRVIAEYEGVIRAHEADAGEALFLVHAGGDAYQASIVPESKLDDAYLLTQWCSLDDIAGRRAAALAHFHDDDSWTHEHMTGCGERIKFSQSFEDGWVEVVRLPVCAALSQPAPKEPQ